MAVEKNYWTVRVQDAARIHERLDGPSTLAEATRKRQDRLREQLYMGQNIEEKAFH